MYIGAQMYTVRQFTQTKEGFSETIKKIAEIGYEGVQLSSNGPIDYSDIRQICDDNGIKIIATHVDSDRLLSETDAVIEEHKIYGAEYIGVGGMPGRYRGSKEGIENFIKDYVPVAQRIKDAGMKFTYHNHAFEFEKYDDVNAMTMINEGFPADTLSLVIDSYWVQYAGGDPSYWIENLSLKRENLVHLKDMKMVDNKQRMAPVFEGNINWDRVIYGCIKSKVKWAFVEQDDCYEDDPFECLKLSMQNITKWR